MIGEGPAMETVYESTLGLLSVPADMLGVILGFLEIYELRTVASVCSLWRRVTMMPWVGDLMLLQSIQAAGGGLGGLGYPFASAGYADTEFDKFFSNSLSRAVLQTYA